MAFARTQHHPLLAEANRPLVPIRGDMPDGEYRHCNPAIDLCSACILCAKIKTGHVNNDPWLNGAADEWGAAFGKALLVALLTAIPTALPGSIVSPTGGMIGTVKMLLPKERVPPKP